MVVSTFAPALLRTRIAREPSRRTGADAFLALVLLAGGTLPARADFQTCLAGLRVTAIAGGVSGETFDQATRGLEPNPDVIAASLSQPEFKTAIWDYLAGLVDDERVADGQAMMRKWEQALASAQSRFGVDPAVVTAVWGVESNFGQAFGTKRSSNRSPPCPATGGGSPISARNSWLR